MNEQELRAVAFPKFSEEQMAALGQCPLMKLRKMHAGENLFAACDRNPKFFIIKTGEVEIIDVSGDAPRTVTVHRPSQFTGDVGQVTGSQAIVSAVARTDGETYEVSADALRDILNNHPDLGDLIMQAFIARRQLLTESGGFTGLRVIGSRYSRETFRVRDFLAQNRVPYTWLDLEEDPQVRELLRQFGVLPADTPVVAWGSKVLLRNPSNRELADKIGLRQPLDGTYDLIVVGAGPAGLAASVYAASEGLHTLLLDGSGPGGQAGRSMRIENYLGFPTGITGADLMSRAVLQANKFGARLSVPTPNIEVHRGAEVARLAGDGHLDEVQIADKKSGKWQTIKTPALFSFIGAIPRTDWLPPEVERDAKGFVLTGPTLSKSAHWSRKRSPFLLETSCAGVFAAGDVRSGSVKRVASAVGEGAMSVQFVHEFLKDM
jgi:thioredoxin reductase (NADPH)